MRRQPPIFPHLPPPPPVVHYGPEPIPLRPEPHVPLTPKSGMRREEIERKIADAGVPDEKKAAWDAKYAKPASGIPKTDLASDVQASLGKADTALQNHQDISGKADLVGGKVPASQLPSYVDDVLEFNYKDAEEDSDSDADSTYFPAQGEDGKIYVDKSTNKTYRWSGTQYVMVGGGDPPVVSVNNKTGAVTLTASDVGAQAVINDLETIRSGATAGATAVQPGDIGTAAAKDVPASGDASSSQVVLGNDSRLSDARTPTSHTHTKSQITDFPTLASVATSGSYGDLTNVPQSFTPSSHQHSMSDITDYVPPSRVQADWDESDSDSDAFIKNKPTIPAPVDISGKADSTALADAYDHDEQSGYAVGDYVTYQGGLYKCSSATSAPAGDWNSAEWTAVAVTDEMGGGGAPKKVWYGTGDFGGSTTLNVTTDDGAFVFKNGNILFVSVFNNGATPSSISGNIKVDGTTVYLKSVPGFSGSYALNANVINNYSTYALFYSTKNNVNCFAPLNYLEASTSKRGTVLLSSTVNNDEDKAATPKAVNSRAPLASPTFTGTPTAPTAAAGTNTTQIATTAFVQQEKNLLAIASTTTLAPETAVYKAAIASDGTFPTITDTGIPTAAAYYQFELELTVPSTVPSTITGPSGWVWLDGHGLPDPADLSGGEVIYISCRMDCGANGKPVLASVWRVS